MLPATSYDYNSFYANAAYNPASFMTNYSSPVSSMSMYPGFADISACISESSPPSDPGTQKKSPNNDPKYREKRERNNTAAKMSRKKRTEREKQNQETIQEQDHKIAAITQRCHQLELVNQQYQQREVQYIQQIQAKDAEIAKLKSQLMQNGISIPCSTDEMKMSEENKENIPMYPFGQSALF